MPLAGAQNADARRVLFACSLNAVRSPMAEGILRYLVGPRIQVSSAGVRAGDIDPYCATVMSEIGIDLSKHKPMAISDVGDDAFDLIISLSPEAHHQALELTRTMPARVEYWPTLDATALPEDTTQEQILASYRKVRDHLFRRVKMRFAVSGGPAP